MACPACRQHVREAGAYRWAVEQARQFLRHEFNCSGDDGPNALMGCLACALDRLALRVSPEITLAAARQPWLERALALLSRHTLPPQMDAAWVKERQEIVTGVARAERMAAVRQVAAVKQAEKERREREKRAETIRTEMGSPVLKPTPQPKETTMKGNGRRKGKKKGKAVKVQGGQPATPPQDITKPVPPLRSEAP